MNNRPWAEYFDNNGLKVDGKKWLKTVDRWDYYIKPIVFGKYWKDRLVLFFWLSVFLVKY